MLLSLMELIQEKIENSNVMRFKREIIQHLVMVISFESAAIQRKYNSIVETKLNRKDDLSAKFLNVLYILRITLTIVSVLFIMNKQLIHK